MGQYNLSDIQPDGPGQYSLSDITSSVKPDFSATGTAKAPSTAERIGHFLAHNPVSDLVGGVGAGVISTAEGAYNLARKIPGVDKVLPPVNARWQDEATAPDGLAGKTGKLLEQAGEFFLPVGSVAKIVEGSPLAARLLAEALTAGGVAGVQTGGDVPAMAETALTTGALGGLGAGAPAAAKAIVRAIVPRLEAAGEPLSAGAEALAQRYGIPLTAGMKTGSPAVQSAEGTLGNTVAPDLYRPVLEGARKGLNAGAQDLSGGFAADRFGAGDNVMKAMLGKADELKSQAQAEYGNLAKLEADPANTRMVQVGTKPNPSADPAAPDSVPDMQPMGLPVDMRPVKQTLASQVDEIQRFMTPAQKRADPGLSAIQNILSRPDQLPASTAEGDLSYLKEVLRSDATPQAKRLAGKAIDAMEPQVQAAVAQAGPEALASLKNARGAWQSRAAILDQVGDLAGDPSGASGQVRLANRLLQPADASFPALEKVLAASPEAADPLGKAYLTEKVFGSAATGNDVNPKQASNLWNHIGPRTKAALYSPEQIDNINDFLSLAKRVGENPALAKGGVVNTLLKVGVFAAHPVGGPASFVMGRNAAKILYSPEGADMLRTVLNAPGSTEASKAMLALKALTDESETAGK